MLCQAENHCILHIKETERKKCFKNEQDHCFQWNTGDQSFIQWLK